MSANVGTDIENLEVSDITGGNIIMYNSFWKWFVLSYKIKHNIQSVVLQPRYPPF